MKKVISFFFAIISLLIVIFFYSKGDIDSIKDFLYDENIEFREVSINEDSIFDSRLMGKRPHHLQITSGVFLHIYKYPSNALAKIAKDSFIRKTEMFDMTAHNLYVAEDMFIIFAFDGVLGDVEKLLELKIEK